MKTKEELNALKEELETLNKKLAELSNDELAEITGGIFSGAGIGIEKGECFEMDMSVLVYEGETTFLPITEYITLDLYIKDTTTPYYLKYNYCGPTSMLAGCLVGLKSLGNKGSIPYRLNK